MLDKLILRRWQQATQRPTRRTMIIAADNGQKLSVRKRGYFDVRAIAEAAGFSELPLGLYDLPTDEDWEFFESLDKDKWAEATHA